MHGKTGLGKLGSDQYTSIISDQDKTELEESETDQNISYVTEGNSSVISDPDKTESESEENTSVVFDLDKMESERIDKDHNMSGVFDPNETEPEDG